MPAGYLLEAFSVKINDLRNIMHLVYQHKKADTNEIFYVGKGTARRSKQRSGRSEYWHRTVNKHGFIVEIIKDNIDEEFAFLIEKEAIDIYKRRGIKLVNITDGGEGSSGYKHTEEHKASLKGNQNLASTWGKNFKGCHHTEETKAKWAVSRKGNKNKLGKKVSEASKEKMRLAKLGKPILARRQFTDEQIRQIRKDLYEMNSIASIARLYKVGESTIRRIRDGVTYQDVK
jgi:group I intron endonuclease